MLGLEMISPAGKFSTKNRTVRQSLVHVDQTHPQKAGEIHQMIMFWKPKSEIIHQITFAFDNSERTKLQEQYIHNYLDGYYERSSARTDSLYNEYIKEKIIIQKSHLHANV